MLCVTGLIQSIWLCQNVRMPFQGEISSKNPYENDKIFTEWEIDIESTEIWEHVNIRDDNSIIVQLLEVFWLEHGTERENDHKFLNYARAIINMALWLVALIALIMTIYTFYMMFFTDNDAWIKKAKWNMVGIFIALGILWLAWIIVSFIFWRYESNWKNPTDKVSINITNNQIYFTV